LGDYILLYSGVPTNKRALAGIVTMIKTKFKKIIQSYMFANERILQLRYKLQRGYLTLLAVCENGIYFENIQHCNCNYIFIWVRKLNCDSFKETEH